MQENPNSIQVIERLAKILDVIASRKESVSLKILSAETGLHPSTAFRILSSLVDFGFVERTSRGNYQLGVKLILLGVPARDHLADGIKGRASLFQPHPALIGKDGPIAVAGAPMPATS